MRSLATELIDLDHRKNMRSLFCRLPAEVFVETMEYVQYTGSYDAIIDMY
jgi:hypothetical protein